MKGSRARPRSGFCISHQGNHSQVGNHVVLAAVGGHGVKVPGLDLLEGHRVVVPELVDLLVVLVVDVGT